MWFGPLAVLLSGLIVTGVVWIFREHGLQAQVSIFFYISTLVSTQISMKLFFKVCQDFKFAAFMTATHLFFTALAADVLLRLRKDSTCFWSLFSQIPIREYFLSMGPIAASSAGSVLANNLSLMYISAGLNALLSSLTPIVTAVLAVFLLGRRYTKAGWFGMTIACSGGGFLVSSGISQGSDNPEILRGILLSGLALVLRASKSVLNDRQMSGISGDETARKYEPLELVVLSMPLSFIFESILSASTESFKPFMAMAARLKRSPNSLIPLVGFILITAVSACVMTMTGLQTMKLLGAPAMQIVGKLHVLIIAIIAASIMHEPVDRGEIFGAGLALLGIYIFNKSNQRSHVEYSKISAECESSGEEQELSCDPTEGEHRDESSDIQEDGTARVPEVVGLSFASRSQ